MAKASTNTGASHQVPKSFKDMAGAVTYNPCPWKKVPTIISAARQGGLVSSFVHQHVRSILLLPSVF